MAEPKKASEKVAELKQHLPKKYVVAPGASISALKGRVPAGTVVDATWFAAGESAVDTLVKQEFLREA